MKRSVFVLICLVGLLGCAGMQTTTSQNHGSVMMDSGFRQWNVDTPQEKAYFSTFPSDKVMTYRGENQVVHVYKDPNSGVVYVGSQDALQSYLQKTNNQGMSPKPQGEGTWDPDFWTMWQDEQGAP